MTAANKPQRDDAPPMSPYARHVLICTGPFCTDETTARRIYRLLSQKLGDLSDYTNPVRVKRSVTSCLGVCIGGPLLAVYPEGIWYRCETDTDVDEILTRHLRDGEPVERLMLRDDQ